MSRPAYRGLTADDLTGPAAGLYSAMRTMGVSEAGALREAVDTHVPADAFDNEARLLALMGGGTLAEAERAVARRHGGSIAEARRVLNQRLQEATQQSAAGRGSTAVTLNESADGGAAGAVLERIEGGERSLRVAIGDAMDLSRFTDDDARRRVEALEAAGLTRWQAINEAQRQEAAGIPLSESTTAAAGPVSERAPAPAAPHPPPTRTDHELRDANSTRALNILGGS